MLILAVESTGEGFSLALGDGRRVWTLRRRGAAREDALLPGVRGLLAKARARLPDLGGVAACSGPGRFTGVRVGMTFAATLAGALGRPAVPVSLFEALAWRSRAPGRTAVLVPGHARSELYMQVFRAGRPAGKPAWLSLPRDASRIAPFRDGAVLCGPVSAADLLGPARAKLARARREPMAPLYLKPAYFETPK